MQLGELQLNQVHANKKPRFYLLFLFLHKMTKNIFRRNIFPFISKLALVYDGGHMAASGKVSLPIRGVTNYQSKIHHYHQHCFVDGLNKS